MKEAIWDIFIAVKMHDAEIEIGLLTYFGHVCLRRENITLGCSREPIKVVKLKRHYLCGN